MTTPANLNPLPELAEHLARRQRLCLAVQRRWPQGSAPACQRAEQLQAIAQAGQRALAHLQRPWNSLAPQQIVGWRDLVRLSGRAQMAELRAVDYCAAPPVAASSGPAAPPPQSSSSPGRTPPEQRLPAALPHASELQIALPVLALPPAEARRPKPPATPPSTRLAAAPSEARSPAPLRDSYQLLDSRLKGFLARLLGLQLPSTVRIYTSPAADRMARQLNADAVTIDRQIFFRRGAYRPQQPAGIALIGHELTHVDQGYRAGSAFSRLGPTQPGPGTRRSPRPPQTHALRLRQEQAALQNERQVRRYLANRPPALAPLPPAPAPLPAALTAPPPPAAPAALPRPVKLPPATAIGATAATNRDVTPAAGPPGSAAPSVMQLSHIKEEVYQSIMDRLRTDFERGA